VSDPQQEIDQGFDRLIGTTFVEASGERVVVTFEVRPDLHQPWGILHGGVHCSVIESAASVGAALWYGDRGHVVGVSNHTDFLRAVRSGRLTATASPIHRGRSQQLWLVEVRDDEERLVARGQVRLANIGSTDNLGGSAGT
jgi:1,4-dihydroxy-2-naphthoyl-CoA hydrolase